MTLFTAPTGTSTTGPGGTATIPPDVTDTPKKCEDNVGNGLSCQELAQDHKFCHDQYSRDFCRLTCGHCVPGKVFTFQTV